MKEDLNGGIQVTKICGIRKALKRGICQMLVIVQVVACVRAYRTNRAVREAIRWRAFMSMHEATIASLCATNG